MKKLFYFFAVFFIGSGCKEIYKPPVTLPSAGYLVVEGYINSGDSPTVITLSRTTGLNDTTRTIYEYNARVSVEGDNGVNYSLHEAGNGVYISAVLNLNNNVKYRLHIFTVNGGEYISDYTPVKYTPPIDSITSQEYNGGLRIYANAHDPQNNTTYYLWKYTETWEFHSRYYSSIKYVYDSMGLLVTGIDFRLPFHDADTTIYKCWKTVSSSNFILGSTEKLTTDRVYLPVQYIEPASEKLSVLYSMELRQYALSHDAYLFNGIMKKNTEQLGSIFDPQPTGLKSNIHCITNPAEIVIGFVEVTQEQIKRVFISNSEIPWWGYDSHCIEVEVDINDIGAVSADLIPTNVAKYVSGSIKSIYAAPSRCIDCTLRGTNVKPSFWP